MDSLGDGSFVDDGDLILFDGVGLIAIDLYVRGLDLDIDITSTFLESIYNSKLSYWWLSDFDY